MKKTVFDLMQSPLGKAHRRVHNVWLHDLVGRMRIRRKTLAKDAGVEDDVETYPIHGGDTTIINQGSGLRAVVVTGLLALVTWTLLAWMLMQPTKQQQPTPPTDPVELEIEFKREDGEWKTIPRRVE